MLGTRRLALSNRPGLAYLVAGFVVCLGFPLRAWEGHDWNQWRQLTTWEKPASYNDQEGRRDLTPLLGADKSATNGPEALRRWEERRKQYVATIEGTLGEPGSDAHGVRALPSELKKKTGEGQIGRAA